MVNIAIFERQKGLMNARYTGRPSPYYKDSHRKLRDAVRQWCEEVCQRPSIYSTAYLHSFSNELHL